MAPNEFAKSTRSAPTDAEAIIWHELRAHRFAGHKFKRQQPLGGYIVDFVCFAGRLIVEVDGGQHNQSLHDADRDAWLMSQGFAVLRFWNNEVLQNLEGVLSRILEALPPSPQPLSRPERGATGSSRRLVFQGKEQPNACTEVDRLTSLPPRGGGTEGEGAQ